jgi:hypothetical protein
MIIKSVVFCVIFNLWFFNNLISQKESYNWCYGNNSLLSFSTSPPSQYSNTSMATMESIGSISDNTGNLLFYTDGVTVYNANHNVMANGTGLFGDASTTNGVTIIKKPASTGIYYIFTLDDFNGVNGLQYSIIDMSLAVGMGSVTSKNNFLHAPSSEKAVAVRHCNDIDAWIVTHDLNSNIFRSYLVSSTGINNSAVLSNAGGALLSNIYNIGQMKVSPNGKKLGLAHNNVGSNNDMLELYDFDNANGIVGNQLILLNQDIAYGCEFSPDGTKFYGNILLQPSNTTIIYQWDLCAGSNSAIIASQYAIQGSSVTARSMQRAPDGKIYMPTGNNFFSSINNPNLAGVNCSYTNSVAGLAMQLWSGINLPNFINTDLKTIVPFSFNNSCQHFSFAAQPSIGNTCAYAANNVSTIQWDFGDPSSGAANTSSLNSPTHSYANAGTYTVQLILQHDCYNDNIQQVVQVNIPILSVSGKTVICRNDKLSLTVSGANTYSWSNGVTSANYTATPNSNIVYTVTGTNTTNLCSSSNVVSVIVNACLGLTENKSDNEGYIYPNPSQGIFDCNVKEDNELRVFNQLGVLVYEAKLVLGENKIDLRHLKSSLYFAHTQGKSSKVIYKIFKEE